MDMKEINEAIKKQLPGEVSEVLQARLKEADAADILRTELRSTKESLGQMRIDRDKARGERDDFAARHKALESDNERLAADNRDKAVQMANLRATEANLRADGVFNLAKIAFGGGVRITETSRDIPHVVKNSYDDGTHVETHNENKTTSEKVE